MSNNKKKISIWKAWKRNLRSWKINWELSPGVFISSILSSFFDALSPYVTIWLSAQLINELAGSRNTKELLKLVLAILISTAMLTLLNAVLLRWKNYELDSINRLEDKIYMRKMLDMDYIDIDSQYSFDLYSQLLQNERWSTFGIRKTIYLFQDMMKAIIQILGGVTLSVSLFLLRVPDSEVGLVFLNNPLFTVTIIALMIVISIISSICARNSNKYWSNYAPEARLGNRYFSFYGHMSHDRKRASDLRMYSQQENVSGVYMDRADSFSNKSKIAAYARGPIGLWMAISESVSVILTGIVYLFVCLKAWAGAFGVGSVTQYVGAITNLFLGVSNLLDTLVGMYVNSEFLGVNYEFLDIPNNMYQGSLTTEKRSDRQYEVEFRNVSFKYPGSESYALRCVNMKFRVGSRLAIVGMNGSGKTTFIKLLCRLYDPTEGQILLNGIDIRKYRYDDYMNIFSVVFQDFQLVALPIGQNVAVSADYEKDRVEDCLRRVGFGDRLDNMPNGLETYIYKDLDKDGVEVSGGEAQKIAIARAIYKDASFIILDEPTAALDPIAESDIYSKFNDIAEDKTVIYISHRLSSCKFCDEIAVFHEGAIVQQGTHKELVAYKSGKYYELWNSQAQYYNKKID